MDLQTQLSLLIIEMDKLKEDAARCLANYEKHDKADILLANLIKMELMTTQHSIVIAKIKYLEKRIKDA